ncbi:hypothetical protein T265_15618, partial [Opisthorchis viverrini]
MFDIDAVFMHPIGLFMDNANETASGRFQWVHSGEMRCTIQRKTYLSVPPIMLHHTEYVLTFTEAAGRPHIVVGLGLVKRRPEESSLVYRLGVDSVTSKYAASCPTWLQADRPLYLSSVNDRT